MEHNYIIESKAQLEQGFNDFSRKDVLSQIEPIGTIPVTLCAEQDYVTVQPARGLEATLSNDVDPALFDRDIVLPETLEAPIEKGQILGTISISYQGKDYGTVNLVASTSLERSQWLSFLDQLQRIFGLLWVKLLLLAIVLIVLIFSLRRAIFGPSRRRNRRRPTRNHSTYSGSYRGRRR